MAKSKKKGAFTEAPTEKVESNEPPQTDDKEPELEMAQEPVEDLSTETVDEPVDILEEQVEKVAISQGLTAKEREALDKKAAEIAEKEVKEKLNDDYLKAQVAKLKRQREQELNVGDDEPMVRHTVNLASHAGHFLINGKAYRHGHTYEVPRSMKAAMLDMEFRGHEQERIRKGNDKNEYNIRERNGIKSGAGVVRA